MADMLAGQWYSRVCGLENLVPENMIHSSIRYCFQGPEITVSRLFFLLGTK